MSFKKVVIEPIMCKNKKANKSIAKKSIAKKESNSMKKSIVKKKKRRKSRELQNLIKSVKGKQWKQL